MMKCVIPFFCYERECTVLFIIYFIYYLSIYYLSDFGRALARLFRPVNTQNGALRNHVSPIAKLVYPSSEINNIWRKPREKSRFLGENPLKCATFHIVQ